MQAAFARRFAASNAAPHESDQNINTLEQSLADDLEIARERSQSSRAVTAAEKVQKAVTAWTQVYRGMVGNAPNQVDWDELDRYAAIVDQQIDLLVNYTAGDAFLYRQGARAAVAADTRLNIAGTALAVLLSGLVAWLLARRIIGPVAAASAVASRIADGQLDGEIPQGSADELRALLSAMRVMRDNIKTMMQNEVAQRRSAQARLADALESSNEGIVLVDDQGDIALANRQAVDFIGQLRDRLWLGARFAPSLTGQVDAGTALLPISDGLPASSEVRLADGRWLRVSRNTTQDGGFIVVCSDIRRSSTRVIEAIDEPFDVDGHHVVIGASIRIAVAPNDGTKPDQLLKNADMALYRAKSTGRGTYHFLQPEMDAQMHARRTLELDLRRALVASEFELYYQPFVDLVTSKVSGFEALVRWNHPKRGLVPPRRIHSPRRGDRPDRPARRMGGSEKHIWKPQPGLTTSSSRSISRRLNCEAERSFFPWWLHWKCRDSRQLGWNWRSRKRCCCKHRGGSTSPSSDS
jgi:PAS domain-containing protein